MTCFRENGRNVPFWAKKAIFGPKKGQNGPNGIFRAKSENVTSVALGSPTLCQKSEQSYDRFSRSPPDGRTYGGDLIGPNRSAGDQKDRHCPRKKYTYSL